MLAAITNRKMYICSLAWKIMEGYTKAQLALRNGQDMKEIWCAYRGEIYDLSSSLLWKSGNHYEHWAGQDLTHEMVDAPHEEWVFRRFKKIGYLK